VACHFFESRNRRCDTASVQARRGIRAHTLGLATRVLLAGWGTNGVGSFSFEGKRTDAISFPRFERAKDLTLGLRRRPWLSDLGQLGDCSLSVPCALAVSPAGLAPPNGLGLGSDKLAVWRLDLLGRQLQHSIELAMPLAESVPVAEGREAESRLAWLRLLLMPGGPPVGRRLEA
jgi:hypothetical protein